MQQLNYPAQAEKQGELSTANDSTAILMLSFIGQVMLLFSSINNRVMEKPNLPHVENSANTLQQIKHKLSALIILDEKRTPNYSLAQQKLDTHFILKALLEMYEENHSDRCKIICLLDKNKFALKIRLAPLETFKTLTGTANAAALYLEGSEEILIHQKIYTENLSILKQFLSHELRHAVDAYENKQAGRWPITYDGKIRHRIFMWGSPKEGLPNNGFSTQLLQDLAPVKNIIEQDINNLIALHKALDNPSSQSADDKRKLTNLLTVIKKYNYQFTLTPVVIPGAHQLLATPNSYSHNLLTNRYRPTQHIISLELNDELFYLAEYTLDPKTPIVAFLTDAADESDYRRLKDLFLSLEFRINRVKNGLMSGAYNALSAPSEYTASIDEVLAPFSHALPGSDVGLRDILFPGLVKLERERHAEEHRSCLAGGGRRTA